MEQLPRCPRGRPLKLADADALALLFKVLRTGMQWREVDATVCHITIFRRFHAWRAQGVFEDAYRKALRTYAKLRATRFYCVDSHGPGRGRVPPAGAEELAIP